MLESKKFYSGTKKTQYLLKNESYLLENYKSWIEAEKKKVKSVFDCTRHDLTIILDKTEISVNDNLDALYKNVLKMFSEIKLSAANIFGEKTAFTQRPPSTYKEKNHKKFQKFRGRDNADVIENFLQ